MITDIVAISGLGVSVLTLLCLLGGWFYWWGRLSSRVDSLEQRADELNDKIDTVRDELNGKIDAVRDELSGKMDAMRTEILTEMQRSEERIPTALTYHSHIAPEAGRPVFWQPIGAPAPAHPPGEGSTTAGQPEAEAPAA